MNNLIKGKAGDLVAALKRGGKEAYCRRLATEGNPMGYSDYWTVMEECKLTGISKPAPFVNGLVGYFGQILHPGDVIEMEWHAGDPYLFVSYRPVIKATTSFVRYDGDDWKDGQPPRTWGRLDGSEWPEDVQGEVMILHVLRQQLSKARGANEGI